MLARLSSVGMHSFSTEHEMEESCVATCPSSSRFLETAWLLTNRLNAHFLHPFLHAYLSLSPWTATSTVSASHVPWDKTALCGHVTCKYWTHSHSHFDREHHMHPPCHAVCLCPWLCRASLQDWLVFLSKFG